MRAPIEGDLRPRLEPDLQPTTQHIKLADPYGQYTEYYVQNGDLKLTRPNGDSAGRYVFRAGRLVSFQLQSGGPIARSVSRVDYEGIHQEHANERSDGTVALR